MPLRSMDVIRPLYTPGSSATCSRNIILQHCENRSTQQSLRRRILEMRTNIPQTRTHGQMFLLTSRRQIRTPTQAAAVKTRRSYVRKPATLRWTSAFRTSLPAPFRLSMLSSLSRIGRQILPRLLPRICKSPINILQIRRSNGSHHSTTQPSLI